MGYNEFINGKILSGGEPMKKFMLTLTVLVLLAALLAVPALAVNYVGTCGEYVTWDYVAADKTLTISGEGAMDDYGEGDAPWAELADAIESVVIYPTVTRIGDNAFYGCEKLTRLMYRGTLEQWLDTKIGTGNWQLGLAEPSCTDWEPDEYAHYGYFGDQGDRVLWLLDGMGTLTVYGTGSADDLCENPPVWEDWKNEIGWVYVKDGITGLDDEAFANCYNLETVELADSVEYLGVGCFSDCPNLKKVKLAAKTDWRELPGSLFSGCTSLETVNIPEGTPVINDLAFYNCTSLKEITIPESVQVIRGFAFGNCSSLKEVYLPARVNRLLASTRWDDYGKGPFAGCTALEKITVSEDSRDYSSDEQGALYNKDQTQLIHVPATLRGTFEVPDTVTYIRAGAFQDCVGLTKIIIPDSVEGMHNKVFQNCTGLKEITIPDSVTEIGYDIFWECTGLESVKLPAGITLLDGFFYGCTSLKEYDIPDTVTELGYRAFYGCTALKTLTIPVSLTEIGKENFVGCDSLSTITYEGYEPQWKKVTIHEEGNDVLYEVGVSFRVCTEHREEIVPAVAPTCLENGRGAGTACGICGLDFEIGELVPALGHDVKSGQCTRCGDYVSSYYNENTQTFYYYVEGEMPDYSATEKYPFWDEYRETMKHLVLGDGVTCIGDYAFSGCTALETVTIPASVTEIKANAFDGCAALTEVNFGGFTNAWNVLINESENAQILKVTVSCAVCETCDVVTVAEIAPTCTANGTTEHKYCGVCGYVFVKPESILTAGHELVGRDCNVCGETVSWNFNGVTGVLHVYGEGSMDDYNGELDMPWKAFQKEIKKVIIEDGITRIGNAAFAVCTALETVDIPDSVTEIGDLAFQMCEELKEAELHEGIVKIGMAAFNGCYDLKTVYIPASVLEIGDSAFAGGLYTSDYFVHPDNPNYCSDEMGVLYNKDQTKLIQVPALRKYLLLPDTLQEIGPTVFSLNDQMTVFFRGTREQWEALKIGFGNECLDYLAKYSNVTERTYCDKGEHFTVVVAGYEASCTTEGLSDGQRCVLCNGMIEAQKTLPKLAHSYQNGKCTVCGEAVSPFTDVKTTDWFAGPVLWAVEAGVTGGKTATTFAPNENCTRAQVVTFLWAANGKPEPASMDNPFTDVPETAWYLKAVLWAVENGITGGTSANTFGPDQYCTRAQVVTFLYAAAGKPEIQAEGSAFNDVKNSDWFVKPVMWAKENDVTGGVSEGMFGPNQICTRSQVVTFLYKVYG